MEVNIKDKQAKVRIVDSVDGQEELFIRDNLSLLDNCIKTMTKEELEEIVLAGVKEKFCKKYKKEIDRYF